MIIASVGLLYHNVINEDICFVKNEILGFQSQKLTINSLLIQFVF